MWLRGRRNRFRSDIGMCNEQDVRERGTKSESLATLRFLWFILWGRQESVESFLFIEVTEGFFLKFHTSTIFILFPHLLSPLKLFLNSLPLPVKLMTLYEVSYVCLCVDGFRGEYFGLNTYQRTYSSRKMTIPFSITIDWK